MQKRKTYSRRESFLYISDSDRKPGQTTHKKESNGLEIVIHLAVTYQSIKISVRRISGCEINLTKERIIMGDLNHKSDDHEWIIRSVETAFCRGRKTVLGKCLNSWSCQFSVWKFKWQKILGGGGEVVVSWMGIYLYFLFMCIYIHTHTISPFLLSVMIFSHSATKNAFLHFLSCSQLSLNLPQSTPSRQSFEAV